MGVDDGGTTHAVGEGGVTLVAGAGVEAGGAGVERVGGFSVRPAVLNGAIVGAAVAAGRWGCGGGGGWRVAWRGHGSEGLGDLSADSSGDECCGGIAGWRGDFDVIGAGVEAVGRGGGAVGVAVLIGFAKVVLEEGECGGCGHEAPVTTGELEEACFLD